MIVSYLRVSTAGQVERESIETQRHALAQYFKQHGIELDRQFEDNGVSGGTAIHKRPQGSELFRLISTGKVTRLYTFDLSRLGRNTIDSLMFLHTAEAHGTRVIGVSDGADSEREGSTLEIEIRSVIASQYRRDRMRQTRAGLRRRAASGKINARPPFAYTVNSDGRLAIDETRAGVMLRIFQRVAHGDRTRDIVTDLNASGAPSPSGKGWRHDTLIYLLKHPVYRGEYPVCWTPKRRPGGGKRIRRDLAERITIQVEQIVSEELFNCVQERLRFNARWHSSRPAFLLRSLIRCGECGRSYVGHRIAGRRYKMKRYPDFTYYECGTQANRDYLHCGNFRVNARKLEAIVWSEIESFITSPSETLERLILRYNATAGSGEKTERQRRKKLESLLAKNRADCDRLTLAVARGVVSDEEALRARKTLLTEAGEIERQTGELQDAETRRAAERCRLLDAESLLNRLRERFDQGLTEEVRREIVRCLVRQITVDKGEKRRPLVTIAYAFKPAFSFGTVGSALADTSIPQLIDPVMMPAITRTLTL